MIRILVDGSVFNEGFHGTSIYLRDLYYHAITDSAFDIIFLVAINSEQDKYLKQLLPNAKRIFYISRNKIIDTLTLHRLINKIKPDFIHFQYKLPFFVKTNKILTVHDILYVDYPHFFPLKYRMIRFCSTIFFLRVADIVITVSKYSETRIRKRMWYNKGIHVLPNTFNFEGEINKSLLFENWRMNYDKIILNINRVEPRKGQVDFIRYIKEFVPKTTSKILLIFVGRDTWGDFTKFRNAEIAELNSSVDFIWFNEISESEKHNWLSNCDIYLNTSAYEGFGIGVLEAAFFNRYIISPVTTGLGELIHLIDKHYDPMNPIAVIDFILNSSNVSKSKDKKDYVSLYNRLNNWNEFSELLLKYQNC
jgi:glycosyltransferase involved in cell wall biosynthesis